MLVMVCLRFSYSRNVKGSASKATRKEHISLLARGGFELRNNCIQMYEVQFCQLNYDIPVLLWLFSYSVNTNV